MMKVKFEFSLSIQCISNILICTIHSINKERKILQTIFVDHIYMYNLKGLQKNQNFETLLKDILKTCNIYIVTGIKWMKIWNWNFVSLEAKNLFDKVSSPLIGYLFFPAPTNFKQSLYWYFSQIKNGLIDCNYSWTSISRPLISRIQRICWSDL